MQIKINYLAARSLCTNLFDSKYSMPVAICDAHKFMSLSSTSTA